MHLSSACKKGIAKNFRSPREREEFARELRRVNAVLDRREQRSEREGHDREYEMIDSMSENLEPVASDLRRKGEITRGARIVHLSHSPS